MFKGQSLLDPPVAPASSTETGIMVLSMEGRILHINETAQAVACLHAGGTQQYMAHLTTLPQPSPLADFFHEVLAHLEKRIAGEDWNQFDITRLIRSADSLVFLRGFGIPDQARRQQSRIILTLHYHSHPSSV
jgi:hypothetical protein